MDHVVVPEQIDRDHGQHARRDQNQEEIDRLRRDGKLVPLDLITNPFYRRYYVDQGWSLPEGDKAETLALSVK